MKVVEKFEDLKKQRKVIEDWYCTNCQECNCSLCPYDYELVMNECNVQQYTSRELEDRWIPVAERLPDLWDERYLVSLAWGGVGVMEYKSTGFHNYGSFSPVPIEAVLAWMPLPEPYKKPYKEEQDG